MKIPLRLLKPMLLKLVDPADPHTSWHVLTEMMPEAEAFPQADGLLLKCPRCYVTRGQTIIGVHSFVCWEPRVSQDHPPTPGRWGITGTSFDDCTLTGKVSPTENAPSSSILLEQGCKAHFYVKGGQVELLDQ